MSISITVLPATMNEKLGQLHHEQLHDVITLLLLLVLLLVAAIHILIGARLIAAHGASK